MSESTHSIYKTEFLKGKISVNVKEHLKSLTHFYRYYNYERFPTELFGLHPMEVIEGKKIDKHYYKEQIKQAGINLKNNGLNNYTLNKKNKFFSFKKRTLAFLRLICNYSFIFTLFQYWNPFVAV